MNSRILFLLTALTQTGALTGCSAVPSDSGVQALTGSDIPGVDSWWLFEDAHGADHLTFGWLGTPDDSDEYIKGDYDKNEFSWYRDTSDGDHRFTGGHGPAASVTSFSFDGANLTKVLVTHGNTAMPIARIIDTTTIPPGANLSIQVQAHFEMQVTAWDQPHDPSLGLGSASAALYCEKDSLASPAYLNGIVGKGITHAGSGALIVEHPAVGSVAHSVVYLEVTAAEMAQCNGNLLASIVLEPVWSHGSVIEPLSQGSFIGFKVIRFTH